MTSAPAGTHQGDAGTAALPPAAVTIRQASQADLPSIRHLLIQRDGHDWTQADTDWFLSDLDPERCLAWLALAGDRPVGLTSMYVRTLRVEGRQRRAGYWANLYVDPAYRQSMLYPRLPMAMIRALAPAGLDFLYASVRRRDVAQTHLRIGFGHVGRMQVLIDPLRPGRLIAKHRNLGAWAQTLAAPLDVLFHLWPRRVPTGDMAVVAEAGWDSPEIDALVALLEADGRGSVAQVWTASSLRGRFAQTREGGRYILLVARMGDELLGAVVYRLAERGAGIAAGIVMEAITRPDRERDLIPAFIRMREDVYRQGGDVLVYLDGLGEPMRRLMEAQGYRASPETYDMLIWPKSMLTSEPSLADLADWRFAFSDHDAF